MKTSRESYTRIVIPVRHRDLYYLLRNALKVGAVQEHELTLFLQSRLGDVSGDVSIGIIYSPIKEIKKQ